MVQMRNGELLIGGRFFGGPCDSTVPRAEVISPFDGRRIGMAAEAEWPHMEMAIECAHEAFASWRRSPRRERQALLRSVAAEARSHRELLADLLALEVGKPLAAGRAEADRLALTFDLAADLLSEPSGHLLPADIDPRGDGHLLRVERFPVGPVLGIVPWNWPLNLAAHKIAPALAAGCTIIIKPSAAAALCTLELGRLIHGAGCPEGVVNVVNCSGELASRAAADPRIRKVSFTGSEAVGWGIKERIADKRVSLELGGDASAIVLPDADLDWAASRLAAGAFAYAGQICISVQHAWVHEEAYEGLRERLVLEVEKTRSGDPTEEGVAVGPMISDEAADRIMEWIAEAEEGGAAVLAGGSRIGRVVEPTLVEDPPAGCSLAREEAFGPVLTLRRVASLDDAISRVNESRFGLQCGVFTSSISAAEKAFQELEAGGVVIGDFPTLRFDMMPYGGVKRSGFGREGLRYAFEEMTELKVMAMRTRT
jgi:acyl-CoA reductase-like NAD-dependent aldehyde dehydrogenase